MWRNFFKKAFRKAGGKFKELKGGFIAINFVPYEIRKIAESVEFKNRYGVVRKEYPKQHLTKTLHLKILTPNLYHLVIHCLKLF